MISPSTSKAASGYVERPSDLREHFAHLNIYLYFTTSFVNLPSKHLKPFRTRRHLSKWRAALYTYISAISSLISNNLPYLPNLRVHNIQILDDLTPVSAPPTQGTLIAFKAAPNPIGVAGRRMSSAITNRATCT
jgi:hypothetical protein